MKQEIQKLDLPYFTGEEKERCTFFAVPKLLWSNETLNTLSNEAKLLYSFMLDRLTLSMEKNFRDNDGHLYIFFTVEEACYVLGKSPATMVRIFSELDCVKGLGLIERKRRGQGKADKIYLKNIIGMDADRKSFRDNKGAVNSEKSVNGEENITVENSVSTTTYPVKIKPLADISDTSCVINSKTLEFAKIEAIKTDKTNPDQKETDLLKPTLPQTPTEKINNFPHLENGEQEEGWRNLENKEKIALVDFELDSSYRHGKEALSSLLYRYRGDENKLETALYLLMDMENAEYHAKNSVEYSKGSFFFRTKKLFARALLEMLTQTSTKVKEGFVNYGKVMDKLLEHISLDDFSEKIRLDSIVDCTIQAYTQANQDTEIKFPLPYMKSCIWTTFREGSIRSEADFQRLYG